MATRQKRKPKTDEEILLKKVRDQLPVHIVEMELAILREHDWRMQRIGEHLRVIRNTVLGQLKKHYDQMVKTKAYKRAIRKYGQVCELIEKAEKIKDEASLEILAGQKKEMSGKLEENYVINTT